MQQMYKGLKNCGELNCFKLFALAKLILEDNKYISRFTPSFFHLPFRETNESFCHELVLIMISYEFWFAISLTI